MNPITVTITGRLGEDPRTFTTRDNTPGVELRLAVDLPPRGEGGKEITRWVKVTAYGLLASRTAASVGKGDRVTGRARRHRQRRLPRHRPAHPLAAHHHRQAVVTRHDGAARRVDARGPHPAPQEAQITSSPALFHIENLYGNMV
jgi:hypothetical protein